MLQLIRLVKRSAVAVLVTSALANSAHAILGCTASASSVVFGAYNPLNAGPLDSTGIVSVTCTLTPQSNAAKVNYSIALSTGASGSMLMRQMQSPPNQLGYNLYTTSAYAQIWGDGTGGSSVVSGSMKLGASASEWTITNMHTMYGRIPAAQDVQPGNYADTIVVTVTY